jgi:hypothetical protein
MDEMMNQTRASLAEVMDDMRANFGIDRRVQSNAQGLVFAVFKKTAMYQGAGHFAFDVAIGDVKAKLQGSGIGAPKVDPKSIERAIRADSNRLIASATASRPRSISLKIVSTASSEARHLQIGHIHPACRSATRRIASRRTLASLALVVTAAGSLTGTVGPSGVT